ncbi:MAG: ABC transporter ATP-binding protein/permease [Actinobacteria bacterium]|nr:ABC transporter ATP-binding protein/permease [Actinomycetota bacterium]
MADSPMTPWTVVKDGSRLIWRFIRMHPVAFAIGAFGAAMYAGAILAASYVVGWVTDNIIIPVLDAGEDPDLLTIGALGIVGVAVFKAVGIVARRTAAWWLQLSVRNDIRNRLVAQMLSLRMSWFDRQAIGDLLAVADADTDQGTGVLGPLPFASGVSLLLVGAATMILIIDPWLGVGSIAGLAVVIAIDIHGSWVTHGMWEKVQKVRGRVTAIAHESFDGALTIKALGREEMVAEHFAEASDTLRDRFIDVLSTWTRYQVIIRSLPQVVILVILVVGALRVGAGDITAGNVVTVVYLLSLLVFPVQLIGFVLWDLAGSLAAWERVQNILDADDHVVYGEARAAGETSPAPVDGSAVVFSYDREPVFVGLDFDLRAGVTLAVVGPTASGKSTLCLLLARLWDPEQGVIRLSQRDLRSFAVSELPKEVAYVAQDSFLFDSTVRENITLGDDYEDDEVWDALKLAGAREFVLDLPELLDTPLGERGTTLSGGQRQRLALARALIRRPRLLILDDATSAVDPSVEAEILRALKAAELPSTVVVVAYRPSSIRLADEVVYVDERRILGHGTHAELLDTVPGYARLVHAYEEEARRLRQETS